jgi:hypothetical protein
MSCHCFVNVLLLALRVDIVIIIIIVFFIHDIHTLISETSHVPRGYIVAAILSLFIIIINVIIIIIYLHTYLLTNCSSVVTR